MSQFMSLLFISFWLTGCQFVPQVAKDIEDVATDTAIKIEVSRETFLKETDLQISVNVQNKDQPAAVPIKTVPVGIAKP